MSYAFLQYYWWAIISLLAGILVFLLFVQGGQSLFKFITNNENEKKILLKTFGHKWEFTFTTLVTFGGAFFASFPLFYSTSFGGAIYVWFAILIFFVIQTVGYEFRSKAGNFLGAKTYECFLFLNGVMAPLLIGIAVGTFFTGAEFIVNKANISNIGEGNVISQWQNPWHGLEAVANLKNLSLGLSIMALSQVLGIQYIYNSVDNENIKLRCKKPLIISSSMFLIFFLAFFISILTSTGVGYDSTTGLMSIIEYKHLQNLIELPIVTSIFMVGVVLVLWSIFLSIVKSSSSAIWFGGVGTVLTVMTLLMLAGYNQTSYYPSLVDLQSSLSISNSSSSHFTLKTMAYASICIPFVITYIWYAWKQMNRKKISEETINNEPTY